MDLLGYLKRGQQEEMQNKGTEETFQRGNGENTECELYMQQKFNLLGDNYSIYDMNKTPVYNVRGSIGGLSLNISRADGRGVAAIKKKVVAIAPKYKINFRNGQTGELKKKAALIEKEYKGKVNGQDMLIKGDDIADGFHIEIGGQVIGSVTRQVIAWGESYKIKAISQEWIDTMVVEAVAIDNALHA